MLQLIERGRQWIYCACVCVSKYIHLYSYKIWTKSFLSILSLLKWSLIDLDVWRHIGNIAVLTCWSCFSQIHTLHFPRWHVTYSQPQQCPPRWGLDGWVETFLLRHKPRYPFYFYVIEKISSTRTPYTFYCDVIFFSTLLAHHTT